MASTTISFVYASFNRTQDTALQNMFCQDQSPCALCKLQNVSAPVSKAFVRNTWLTSLFFFFLSFKIAAKRLGSEDLWTNKRSF